MKISVTCDCTPYPICVETIATEKRSTARSTYLLANAHGDELSSVSSFRSQLYSHSKSTAEPLSTVNMIALTPRELMAKVNHLKVIPHEALCQI